jgi:hypothetical protein
MVDSEELQETIEKQSNFNVDTDLSKATKREDVLAYKLSINLENLIQKDNINEIQESLNTTQKIDTTTEIDSTNLYDIQNTTRNNNINEKNYINSKELKKIDIEELDDETFDLLMSSAEEKTKIIQTLLPSNTILQAYAYKIDSDDNTLKILIAIAHRTLGNLKLNDVIKRLKKEVD